MGDTGAKALQIVDTGWLYLPETNIKKKEGMGSESCGSSPAPENAIPWPWLRVPSLDVQSYTGQAWSCDVRFLSVDSFLFALLLSFPREFFFRALAFVSQVC